MDNDEDQLCQWNVKNIFTDEYNNVFMYLANCSVTQTHGHLYVTWQDMTSKSLYYQQRLTHYSGLCFRKLEGHWRVR